MGASRAEGASVKTLAPPLYGGTFFSPNVEFFLGLSMVRFTKLSVGAYGLATRVVPNMSFSQALY